MRFSTLYPKRYFTWYCIGYIEDIYGVGYSTSHSVGYSRYSLYCMYKVYKKYYIKYFISAL